jgi:Ni/Fe-hydrogenase subunit HybB-like protein
MADPPLVPADRPLAHVDTEIARVPQDFPGRRGWRTGAGISLLLLLGFVASVSVLFAAGIGIWGVNSPAFWGVAIMNYVWWVGIGNAGTLISALLLLLGKEWRNALNRFAEAMTLFAMICAGIYPIIHLGRPWLFYWMFPYPNVMEVWPQFRSPLTWDVFAILIYLIVSILFWYTGLIPDLATMRDRARTRFGAIAYGIPALGWRGSAMHWLRWRRAYVFLAAVAVPLVVSVHSEVAMLFAASSLPGWHSTLFPPFFVVGAAFSGFGVVTMLAIVIRSGFHLEDLLTVRHFDILARIILGCALLMGYSYGWEVFDAVYSGSPYDLRLVHDRVIGGRYAWSFWTTLGLNVVLPQLLWWHRLRANRAVLFAVSLGVTVGMWFERYMLIVTSLYKDFLPSSWGAYTPTFWDWAVFAGTIGLFLFPFFLFVRVVPLISISETKDSVAEAKRAEARGGEA